MKRLTTTETEALEAKFDGHVEGGRTTLLALYEGEAHKARGYDSWDDYAYERFGLEHAQAYRLLRAAWVVRALASLQLETQGLNESQARELAPLLTEDGALAVVATAALAEGTWKELTASRVKSIADLEWFLPKETSRVNDERVRRLGEWLRDAAAGINRSLTTVDPSREGIEEALCRLDKRGRTSMLGVIKELDEHLALVRKALASASEEQRVLTVAASR